MSTLDEILAAGREPRHRREPSLPSAPTALVLISVAVCIALMGYFGALLLTR